MATKKGAKKGAASKKSTRGKEASPADQPSSTGVAVQPDLDMKIDLMATATASASDPRREKGPSAVETRNVRPVSSNSALVTSWSPERDVRTARSAPSR